MKKRASKNETGPTRIWTTGEDGTGEYRDLHSIDLNEHGDFVFTLDGRERWRFTPRDKIGRPAVEDVDVLGSGLMLDQETKRKLDVDTTLSLEPDGDNANGAILIVREPDGITLLGEGGPQIFYRSYVGRLRVLPGQKPGPVVSSTCETVRADGCEHDILPQGRKMLREYFKADPGNDKNRSLLEIASDLGVKGARNDRPARVFGRAAKYLVEKKHEANASGVWRIRPDTTFE